jgi:hypothetical protein
VQRSLTRGWHQLVAEAIDVMRWVALHRQHSLCRCWRQWSSAAADRRTATQQEATYMQHVRRCSWLRLVAQSASRRQAAHLGGRWQALASVIRMRRQRMAALRIWVTHASRGSLSAHVRRIGARHRLSVCGVEAMEVWRLHTVEVLLSAAACARAAQQCTIYGLLRGWWALAAARDGGAYDWAVRRSCLRRRSLHVRARASHTQSPRAHASTRSHAHAAHVQHLTHRASTCRLRIDVRASTCRLCLCVPGSRARRAHTRHRRLAAVAQRS